MRHQRSIRFSERVVKDIDTASRQRGFSSSTAFIRYAVEQELLGRQEALIGAERNGLQQLWTRCAVTNFG